MVKQGLFLLIFVFYGCGSKRHQQQLAFTQAFKNQNFQEAHNLLEESEIAKEERSKLLFLLEKGKLFFAQGQHHRSSLIFEKAKESFSELYTIKLGRKLRSAILNDEEDSYYGLPYERSMLSYYQALNFIFLSQSGEIKTYQVVENDQTREVKGRKLNDKERREFLYKARAEVFAWNNFLDKLEENRIGKSVYLHDLLAKVFGGLVHEMLEKRSEKQIALQLYKDALKILEVTYLAYPAFNLKAKEFKRYFDEKRPTNQEPTKAFEKLQSYLQRKVAHLTWLLRRRQFQKTIRKYGLQATKDLKRREIPNVFFLHEESIIPGKEGDEVQIGLQGAINQSQDGTVRKIIATIGAQALTLFAAHTLGLIPRAGVPYGPGAEVGLHVAHATVLLAGINFELPKIPHRPVSTYSKLEVFDSQKKLVTSHALPLTNPLGEIARELVAEDASERYLKTGTRLALKHTAAIATAYLTYKGLSKKEGPNFWAKNAALLQYLAASKVIESSERADTRFWSTLPDSINLVDFYLAPGTYQFFLKTLSKKTDAVVRTHDLGAKTITKKKQLIHFRSFPGQNLP